MIRIVLICLCISATSFQNGSGRKIANQPTPKHMEIGRSGLSFIPPSGFRANSSIRGFEHPEKQAQITAGQLSFPFSTMAQGLKEEMKGDHVRILESLTINGYEALLVKHSEKAPDGVSPDNMVVMLVFGDRNATWQVSGVYPAAHDGALGLAVEKALLTTTAVVDDDLEDEAAMVSTFAWFGKMGLDPGRLKLANKLGASIIFFNLDGKIPTQAEEALSFTVSRYSGSKISPEEVSRQKVHALNPDQPPVVKAIEKTEIAGMKGYEIVAYMTDGQERSLVYQITLFGDLNYYRLLGRADTDLEARLREFRSISETFRVK